MFKKIKNLIEMVEMLTQRVENLERAYKQLWDETHPKTMGGHNNGN